MIDTDKLREIEAFGSNEDDELIQEAANELDRLYAMLEKWLKTPQCNSLDCHNLAKEYTDDRGFPPTTDFKTKSR